MIERLQSITDSVKSVHEVQEGKTATLEKGDFAALMSAAWQTLGKTALLVILFFAAIIAILLMIWGH